jgi:hypothetical protein
MKLPIKVKRQNQYLVPIYMGIITSGITYLILRKKTSNLKSIALSLGVGALVGIAEAYYGFVQVDIKE